MTKLLLIGSDPVVSAYIDNYILDNKFLSYEVLRIEQAVTVEQVRSIVKQLSYSVATKLLIVISGKMNIPSQNALLKCLEDAQESVHFIFCAEHEDMYLPTIRSRCIVKSVESGVKNASIDLSLCDLLEGLTDEKKRWNVVGDVEEYLLTHDIVQVKYALRHKLLHSSSVSESEVYYLCLKKMLAYVELYRNNNVNRTVFLEQVFLSLGK